MKNIPEEPNNGVWFVYDGQCPLCLMGATHFRVRQAAGELHLLDARENTTHPLMLEIRQRGLNLDDGMVLVMGNNYYQGADALHIMAMLGSNHGCFNRMNALLFRSPCLSKLLYPSLRGTRTVLLKLKGVEKINNLTRHAEQREGSYTEGDFSPSVQNDKGRCL